MARKEGMACCGDADRGLYCYKVMPFGLKNARATYQRLEKNLFASLIDHTMEVYVDDILGKSRTDDQHIPNLSTMFAVLKRYNMRLNPMNCAFDMASGKFLRFMISQQGIEANPEKIQAILCIKVPKAVKAFKDNKTSTFGHSPGHRQTYSLINPRHLTRKDNFDLNKPLWTLHVDGSFNSQGRGIGLVLISPDKVVLEYTLHFKFHTSNNVAECEALLAVLRLAKEMDVT
ncbi:hypothetical protein L3X38_042258 [Prunus dulcis]|uniref:RNase H type-1 domain-containing protein n=1 Tax=Prunus dulcis TaxID=3755 RepID=A0AAD4UVY3_PRUDU|nr:hypothetical protein L3X38_042258 [Prunus dulcis]